MTSADYIDREGIAQHEEHFWKQEDVFSRTEKESISSIVSERIDNFQIYGEAKKINEQKLIDKIESQGGKVIKLTTQPISKRRYKRNVAKLLAKEKATY